MFEMNYINDQVLKRNYDLVFNTPISSGSFGSIYLIKNIQSQKKYVLKVLNFDTNYSEEILVLQKINSDYVIKYVDSFQKDFTTLIIMEYCEYGDLAIQIDAKISHQNSFKLITINQWSWQIINGLHYLHSNSIIHRDIKPGNIFLTKNGSIKLGDLGSARLFEDTVSVMSTYAGTPIYMSHELRKKQNYTYATDCWSAGCTIYELVTLTRFFTIYSDNERNFHSIIEDLDASNLLKSLLKK